VVKELDSWIEYKQSVFVTFVSEDEALRSTKRQISLEKARLVGVRLGINWTQVDLVQFRRGLEVELKHGARDPENNVTNDDLMLTGKIALAHLKEARDYYTRLDQLESEAKGQAPDN
jgi:hypothetical protein